MLADRLLAAKVLARERLVDRHYMGGSRAIAVVEEPAAQQRDAHRLEVTRRRRAGSPHRRGPACRFRGCSSDFEGRVVELVVDGHFADRAGRFDAGQSHERRPACAPPAARFRRNRRPSGASRGWRESARRGSRATPARPAEGLWASRAAPISRQIEIAVSPITSTAPTRWRRRPAPARLSSRRPGSVRAPVASHAGASPKNSAVAQRYEHREQDDASIQPHLIQARQAGGSETAQQRDAPPGERHRERARHRGEQQVLGQQLPQNARRPAPIAVRIAISRCRAP